MTIKFNKQRRIECILFIALLLFLCQNPLSYYVSVADYFDEGFAFIGWVILMFNILKHIHKPIRLQKWKYRLLIYISFIVGLGICGNIIWGFQRIVYVLFDIFAFSKFFVGIFLGFMLSVENFSNRFNRAILLICKIIAIVQFGLAIHEQLFSPWFEYLNEWNYIRSIKLYYSNQTYLVAYSIFVLALLVLFSGNKKEVRVYGSLLIIPVILTMRSKAWGFLVLYSIVTITTKRNHFKNPILFGIISMPLILYVARNKIILYFFSHNHFSPRLIILKDGWNLAKEYFPIGTGFGTYCSTGATLGGSPVYDMLGTNYSSYYIAEAINDMYWGHMLGQFGFLGTLVMIAVLLELLIRVWKLQNRNRRAFLTGICLMLYLIIASIGESPFFSSYIIGFAFVIGMQLRNRGMRNYEKNIVIK